MRMCKKLFQIVLGKSHYIICSRFIDKALQGERECTPRKRRAQEGLRLNVSIIYTWLVKTLHNMPFSFALLLFSSCPLGFFRTLTSLLSLSQCCQPSATFSTQLRKTRTLRRTSSTVLRALHCQEAPFFPSCPRPPPSVHVSQIDIPERDRHVCTHVHCENISLIQSFALIQNFALMRSATKNGYYNLLSVSLAGPLSLQG